MISDIEYAPGITPVKEEYITTNYGGYTRNSKPVITKIKIILTLTTPDGTYLLVENEHDYIELISPECYSISTLPEVIEYKQDQQDLKQYEELRFKLKNKGLI